MRELGKDVRIDTEFYRKYPEHDISKYFKVDIETISFEKHQCLLDDQMDVISRVRRKLFGVRDNSYRDKEEGFDNKVFDLSDKKDLMINGYWQNELYFKDIEETIRESFVFKDYLTDYQRGILRDIINSNAVSVHIRRGDYLQGADSWGGICTDLYYKRAMDKIREVVSDVKFFVFSNDYEWVLEHYANAENVVCVKPERNYPETNMDMLLMSKCKHNVIANSSFSWWGAWLNENPQKMVISPVGWNNKQPLNDPVCEGWIRVCGK